MRNMLIAGEIDQFAARFMVDIPVAGSQASGVARTGWIFESGSSTPELTTLFVK